MTGSERGWVFADAWVLTAIAVSTRPCSLTDIVAAGDGLNHALLLDAEVDGALGKLQGSGLRRRWLSCVSISRPRCSGRSSPATGTCSHRSTRSCRYLARYLPVIRSSRFHSAHYKRLSIPTEPGRGSTDGGIPAHRQIRARRGSSGDHATHALASRRHLPDRPLMLGRRSATMTACPPCQPPPPMPPRSRFGRSSPWGVGTALVQHPARPR